MFRSVAYFMMESGAMDEAIQIFRRVLELAPGEPHSFLVWRQEKGGEGRGQGGEGRRREEKEGGEGDQGGEEKAGEGRGKESKGENEKRRRKEEGFQGLTLPRISEWPYFSMPAKNITPETFPPQIWKPNSEKPRIKLRT
jgi:hypothetical protein